LTDHFPTRRRAGDQAVPQQLFAGPARLGANKGEPMGVVDFVIDLNHTAVGLDGRAYRVRVRGHPTAEKWEAVIEFDPQDGTPTLRTKRETEQRGRKDLDYWAAGLTPTYLEGALARARRS
jgi:hypothetical protein